MKNRSRALNWRMSTHGLTLNNTSVLYHEFFRSHDYDWWYKVQPGDIVVDVGACVGFMSAKALDLGAEKVYMIEGNRELLKTAIHNVSEYMMNETEQKIFPINCLMGTGNKRGVFKTDEDTVDIDDVDVMSFKEFVRKYNIDHIDFLKMDIEGNEYDTLNTDNLEFMKNNVRHIAVEVHTRTGDPNCFEKFIECRDTFLKPFHEAGKLKSMGNQPFVDKYIWDNDWMRTRPDANSYFMLYITNY